jgi:hypothetical protein
MQKGKRQKGPRKAAVNIWCKIYTNNFSEDMVNKTATGQEIYEFLMKDSGNCFDDNDRLMTGDCNLWYLGCNEKFGNLRYKRKIWTWGFGEASFHNVEMFVTWIYMDGMFTQKQYQTLIGKIEEGRQIGDMYRITDYLLCRQEGKPWPAQGIDLKEAS